MTRGVIAMNMRRVTGLTNREPSMTEAGDMNQSATDRVMAGEMKPVSRQGGRRLVEIGILVALIGGALIALPGLDEFRSRLAGADPRLIALAAILEVGSCLAFVAAFRGVFSRGLSWRFSYEVGMAEQAANVLLPTGGGGLALGAWALRRVGMPAERIGRRTVAFFLVTSSVNFAAVVLAGLGLALGLLPGRIAFLAAAVPALLAVGALTAIALAPRVLERAEPGTGGRIRTALAKGRRCGADGIRDAISLVVAGRPLVVLGAVGYMGLDVAALAAVFAAFGGGAPSLGIFVLAYAVGQLGGLVPLPGGVGGTDGGLILAFGLLGTPVAIAAAAVIGYRAFQLGVPALLGITAMTRLRRSLATEGAAEPTQSTVSERRRLAPQFGLEPA
jgi:uncharacterized membrane protein YbhN (UPF0104 family)